MTETTLDTSGAVDMEGHRRYGDRLLARQIRWSDLSPFVQGYVEALWLSAYHDGQFATAMKARRRDMKLPGFSDLSPEALALILRDCEALTEDFPGVAAVRAAGSDFWMARNHPEGLPRFPPLTPYLSDDGKVCLREAA